MMLIYNSFFILLEHDFLKQIVKYKKLKQENVLVPRLFLDNWNKQK